MNVRQSRIERIRRLGLWIVLAIVLAGFSIVSPVFRSSYNLINVLEQNSIIGIVAAGMAVMMIAGGFDLSVGATGASASVVAAVIAVAGGGDLLAIVAGLAIGLVIGIANGVIIARLGINAFVTTFAMASIVSGLLFVATDAHSTVGVTPVLKAVSTIKLGPVPVVFFIFLAVLALVWFFLTRTRFGHYVYSVGGNAEASHLSGVPVAWVRILAFAIGGLLAGLGGLLLLGQTQVGTPSGAIVWPLQAIAICVVGGVALTGGVGRIPDVLAATLLLGYIGNGLKQVGVTAYWLPAVTGVVILGAVILDQYNRRRRTAPRPTADDSRLVPTTGEEVRPAA
ncbi:MAG TPA: ABC transporter permease [Pseudolysinimonas sp.]|jgi:ribose/xylose/arabinose/galactoside ABC-type transport system permease subunit|nr:Permease component of ribose/xylose/arabinose/galactoside ABC-type transporter [Schumannella sp.]HEV7742291.1 ABC transporter permease [Pseudolysinimonas sp.]